MKWVPKNPIVSTIIDRKDIKSYKRDYKFDFIKGDLMLNQYVEGLDGFIQEFIKILITNETPIIKYGLLELIPRSTTQNEFDDECTKLASAIVNHIHSDSTPNSPNGLGHTVEAIHSIERTDFGANNDCLLVTSKLTGMGDLLEITVPLKLVAKFLKD